MTELDKKFGRAAKRVLVVEKRPQLRELLGDLLRRRGLDVTEQSPEDTDLHHGCPYDAVVFNADQNDMRRKRWLFGYAPTQGRTRLVALHEEGHRPEYNRREIDAALPYPLSVTELVHAVLGGDTRIQRLADPPSPSAVLIHKTD